MIEIIYSLTNDFSLVGGREVAPLNCASVAKKGLPQMHEYARS